MDRVEPPRFTPFALAAAVPLLVIGLLSAGANAGESTSDPAHLSAHPRVVRTVHVMGTQMVTTVEGVSRESALIASETILDAVVNAERRLSTWTPTSELSQLNAAPVGEPFPVSSELARDLESALNCARETDGAFTPGIGGLVETWELRKGGRRPSREEIRSALSGASLDNVRLEDGRVARLHSRFVFEEGAFGKGAGLDDALARLETTAATAAVIDLGGQVMVWGRTRASVDIAHPRDRDRAILRLGVSQGSVATSGSSERGIVVGGERLGHILDPRTGQPSGDFGSVTVWAREVITADCLSTALFVMGPAAAHAWASRHPDLGVVTVVYEEEHLTATATSNLHGRLVVLSNDVDITWSNYESRPRARPR